MKVKELRALLDNYPDDMEVMNHDEVSGPYPIEIPVVQKLVYLQHHEWNSKEKEWNSWDYPTNYALYRAEVITEEDCLIFTY
jgi:hypothetical protein